MRQIAGEGQGSRCTHARYGEARGRAGPAVYPLVRRVVATPHGHDLFRDRARRRPDQLSARSNASSCSSSTTSRTRASSPRPARYCYRVPGVASLPPPSLLLLWEAAARPRSAAFHASQRRRSNRRVASTALALSPEGSSDPTAPAPAPALSGSMQRGKGPQGIRVALGWPSPRDGRVWRARVRGRGRAPARVQLAAQRSRSVAACFGRAPSGA
jgi:hypothetical protein